MEPDKSGSDSVSEDSTFDLTGELADCRQHKPWQSGLFSKLLFKAADLRLVLIAMEAGAKMKEHHTDGSISIHVLEGTLCVHESQQPHELRAGQVLTVAAGIKHDVEAHQDAAFLLTISWPGSGKAQAPQHREQGYPS